MSKYEIRTETHPVIKELLGDVWVYSTRLGYSTIVLSYQNILRFVDNNTGEYHDIAYPEDNMVSGYESRDE